MKTKFSGKRPVVFFQQGRTTWGALNGSRVRIFYPNGKAEWCAINSPSEEYEFKDIPCWIMENKINKKKAPKSINDLIELAKEYDQLMGFPRMELLEEL